MQTIVRHALRQLSTSLIVICLCTMASFGQSEEIRLEPTRDTWLSAVGEEARGANGGAPRLKFKSIQELSLIDFDFAKLRGKDVQRCRLFLKRASDTPLDRITVSTMGAEWFEGTATNYEIVAGQSTFTHQRYPDVRWADSDITAVCLGAGSTIWRSIKPNELDDGWYSYEVPPQLVEQCIAGLSFGWLIMDDTGSTWKRDGEKFEHQLFPNRFAFSRDSNRSSLPYLLVECSTPNPAAKPDSVVPPSQLMCLPPDAISPDSRGLLIWKHRDNPNGLAGFKLSADGKPIDPYFLPSLERSTDGRMTMCIDPRFPPWDLSRSHELELRSVDKWGNQSQPQRLKFPGFENPKVDLPVNRNENSWTTVPTTSSLDWSESYKLDGMQIAVIDSLDQLSPSADKIVPANRPNYLKSNALWEASTGTVRLSSSRGAWVGFQLAIANPTQTLSATARLPGIPSMPMEVYRYEYVTAEQGLIADPLIPIGNQQDLSKKLKMTASQKSPKLGCWLFEMYVPPGTDVGDYEGTLELHSGATTCSLPLKLKVGSRVIPKELGFLPEMNCYQLPANDRDYYRLGNRHRVVVNRVPYYQNGQVAAGMAPGGNIGQWNWNAWDQRFSELFTGQAFADLPRGKIPMECFYFPMHENWPLPMDGNYNGSYWADEAFPEAYRQAWEQTVADFIQHVEQNQWLKTRFHVFLNNKVDFKKRGWSRGSSPWLLDEPANFQDYMALRYFGLATKAAYDRTHRESQVLFRCDISRPQWQRTTLDGLLQYNVVSQTAFREYRRLVLDRKQREGQTVMVYGSNNPIGTNNIQSVAWSWDAWCRGADGIVPWQTIGNQESWSKADELALFYPDPTNPDSPPLPSIRLKAYCYAQQDVELLRLHFLDATAKQEVDRYTWGEQMLQRLPLGSVSRKASDATEDAGWADYGNITPETFELLRRQLQN